MHFPENRILILTSQESKNKPTLITFPSQALHIVRSQMRILSTKKVPQFSCFEMRLPRQGMLHAYVRTRIQQRFYFFAVTSVTEGEK